MARCIKATLRVGALLVAISTWSWTRLGYCQELPILEPVRDVEVQSIPGVSGLIAVTLESTSGENQLRILDLEKGLALKPSLIEHAISDVTVSPLYPGMVYSKSPKSGGELMWSLLDGSLSMDLSSSAIKQSEVTFGRSAGEYLFVGEFNSDWKELFRISSTDNPSIRQLTRFGGRNTTPHVNPVSGMIAYSTSRKFPGWDVCFFDPTTEKSTCPLGSSTISFCRPKWSPTGDQIVFSRGQGSEIDLYSYNPDTGQSQRLTSLAHKEYDGAWSPDASHIVFSHNAEGGDVYDLKVLRVQDGSVLKLASSGKSLRGPAWIHPQAYSTPIPKGADIPPTQTPPPQIDAPTTATTPVAEIQQASPPKLAIKSRSRNRVQVTVEFSTEVPTQEVTVKVQVNDKVSFKKGRKGRAIFDAPRPAMVRAAIRPKSYSTFSEWSPWKNIGAAKSSRKAE